MDDSSDHIKQEEKPQGVEGKKKKKSKLEKIYELQAANKSLKEENRALRKEIASLKAGVGTSSSSSKPPKPILSASSSLVDDSNREGGGASSTASTSVSSGINNEEKLMEAMRALKRVTVKQEMSLNTIRSKAEQRRKQIADRDETISSLQGTIDAMKQAQQKRIEAAASTCSSSVEHLACKVEELQLQCSQQESENKALKQQMEASEKTISMLQEELDSAKVLIDRAPSNRSLKSHDTSNSDNDIAKLRKELASKIEKIVLLEFDLELCKEELHELRHNNGEPHDPELLNDTKLPVDYFTDTEEDDDWT